MSFRHVWRRAVIFGLLLLIAGACVSQQPKKRSQPKKGPIPCPVKDC